MSELELLPPLRREISGYRWSSTWACWVPIVEHKPLPVIDVAARVPYSPRHYCGGLDCVECGNAGVRMADWLKAKRLREL